MRRGWTLLVIGQGGEPVRQLYVPRALVWGAAIGVVCGAFAIAAAAWRLACHPKIARDAAARISRGGPAHPLGAGAAAHALTKKVSPLVASSQPLPSDRPCPSGMVLVQGKFCPKVEQRCLEYVDPEGSSLRALRCGKYERPARCLSPRRQPMRFCIDRDEHVAKGQSLPQNFQSFETARATCAAEGKRLCTEREWTFACEGEKMSPYPYGWERDKTACNADRGSLVKNNGKLEDLRVPVGSMKRCISSFGVRDLAGNVEEFVLSGATDARIVRKGAYWQPGANNCRASQPESDPNYKGVETGFRCCAGA